MDFRELLNIAAKNTKIAEKEATVSRRYTTVVPPPKKEKRAGVDLAAIRARLEKKQQEKQQKVVQEEAKKQELLKLRAESKKKKKSADKPQENGRPRNSSAKPSYDDSRHEIRHRSFMKKVQHVVETTKTDDETETVSKAAPDRPKKPKKPAVAPKGPMSYTQLLALAADQQKGGKEPADKPQSQTKPKNNVKDSMAKQKQQKNSHQMDAMDVKKAMAARKLGEMRRQEFLAQRRGNDGRTESGSAGKSKVPTTNGTVQQHRTNGKVIAKSGVRKPETVTSKPKTSTSKTKHSSSERSRPNHNISDDRTSKSVPDNERSRQQKGEPERKKPPLTLQQSRVDEYFDKAPSGQKPRPVAERQPVPKRQSKMEKYFDRVPSSSRPQPGLDRRAPPMGQHMPRKRPASSAPSFHAKHGRLLSEEESDYEEDGFIDDTPLEEEAGRDVSKYIKEIFGYDKSKYGYESDYALRNMDASYREIQQEEARSAQIGMQEDLEDIRKEREEKKKLAQKMAKKKKR